MSDKITFIDKKSQQLVDILNNGKEKSKNTSPMIALEAFLICAIGTTIPFQVSNTIFSILSLAFLTVLAYSLIWNWAKITLKQKRVICGTVLAAFLVSGCSGLSLSFMDDPPEPLIVLQNHKDYKIGQISGLTFFGFGWDNYSVEKAMEQGEIEKAFAIQERQSFGLVSSAYIKVYGE